MSGLNRSQTLDDEVENMMAELNAEKLGQFSLGNDGR